MERLVADYLALHVDDVIDRRVKRGVKDTGDIGGLKHLGNRIVVEVKDYGGRLEAAAWTREAHVEMGNDGATASFVVAKRRGTTDPGSQWVLMTLNDMVGLLTGYRPDSDL